MKILFKVFPQASHYNATFAFAETLRNLGHEVTYAGIEAQRQQVEAQGFSFQIEPEDVFAGALRPKPVHSAEWLFRIARRVIFWREERIAWKRTLNYELCSAATNKVKPDLILVDSPYTLYATSLFRSQIPFAILESMVALDEEPNLPPLESDYVPTDERFSQWWCRMLWRAYYFKRAARFLLGISKGYHPAFVVEYATRQRVTRDRIIFRRYLHIGLQGVPEIVLSPKIFDLPRADQAHRHHLYAPRRYPRNEVSYDYSFEQTFAKLREERCRGRPLVFCSLGTAAWRYAGAQRFLQRVIIASSQCEWNLLVVIGRSFRREEFEVPSATTTILRFVPQMTLLHETDLMITHGGMNSICECAALGVPMLVYPGTAEIDQPGNAARVAYHGLGRKGNMRKDSVHDIGANIREILATSEYTQRAREFQRALQQSEATPGDIQSVIEGLANSGYHRATFVALQAAG